ncbi:stealth family protein [Streptococcus sp. A11]
MNKIDFVIPWVDGYDEVWQKDRLKYSDKIFIDNDYRDWGLLKYWFRAIEKNAPWVNKIYFITYGHLPDFLNIDHPKLVIVKHEDYIPKEYLPTFSSHVIELNLHRINDLSEKFVYFNDDFFLLNEVKPADFFVNDLPRECAIQNPVAPARYDAISSLLINNTSIINQHFKKHQVIKSNLFSWFNYRYGLLNLLNLIFIPWGRFVGFYEHHLHTSFLKSTFEEIWNKETELLHNTSLNRVRNFKTDVNQWLVKDWQVASNRFFPRSVNFGRRFLVENEYDAQKVHQFVKTSKKKIVCVNDHVKDVTEEEFDKIIAIIKEGFKAKYAEKSSFEK